MLKVRKSLVTSNIIRTFASETNNSVGDNLKKINYGTLYKKDLVGRAY